MEKDEFMRECELTGDIIPKSYCCEGDKGKVNGFLVGPVFKVVESGGGHKNKKQNSRY